MYEPRNVNEMLAVAKTLKSLGLISMWIGVKYSNYMLHRDVANDVYLWEKRCFSSSNFMHM